MSKSQNIVLSYNNYCSYLIFSKTHINWHLINHIKILPGSLQMFRFMKVLIQLPARSNGNFVFLSVGIHLAAEPRNHPPMMKS